RAAPSTTRTPLRARGYPSSADGSRVELLDLFAADAADDLHPAPQPGMVRELELRAGSAVGRVRDREDELLDVRCEQRAHAHRARLHRREDGHVAQSLPTDLARRLAQRVDDGVGRRVVRLANPVVAASDQRLVEHGDRSVRPLATGDRGPGLGQCLAHVQLVVHERCSLTVGIIRAGATITVRMSGPKRIGVLTGGGDVPGLNSVIKSVTYRATEMGMEVVGFRRGWEGLTHVRPGPELDPDYARPLDRRSTRTIDRTGGTVLHTSRTNPARMKASTLPSWLTLDEAERYRVDEERYDLTPVVLEHLEALGIDALVPIGGDDTLSFARILAEKGVHLVAIPKTMDNDVPGTEYCIGFSSAITRAKELIDRQRTTLGSHERIGVFRIFGRDAGFSALFAAYVTSARCVIPEAPYDLDALASLLADDHRLSPSHYAIVVAAEGAIWQGGSLQELGEADAFGHRHKADIGESLALEITRRTGIESLAIELTYDLRSGQPDALDQIVATTFANVAMDLLIDGQVGRMVAIRDGKYAETSLLSTGGAARRVDVDAMYNRERFRPRYDGRIGRPLLLVGLSQGVEAAV